MSLCGTDDCPVGTVVEDAGVTAAAEGAEVGATAGFGVVPTIAAGNVGVDREDPKAEEEET